MDTFFTDNFVYIQNSEIDGVPVRKKSILVNNPNVTNNIDKSAINDTESIISHHSHGK